MTQTAFPGRPTAKAHPVAGALLALLGVFGGLLWLIPAAILVLVVPTFVEIFAKFDISGGLPTATQAVITVAQGLSTWWPVAALVWLAVVGVLAAVCLTVRVRWAAVAAGTFAALSLVAVQVTVVVIVLALFIPMVRLVEGVGQQ